MTELRPWVAVTDLPEKWEHRGTFGATDDPEQHGDYAMTIHRDGNTISVGEVAVKWDPRRRVEGLGTVNLRALAERILLERLWDLAIDRMRAELGPAGMFERIEEARDDARAALGLSRTPTPKSRIDTAFLKEVVDVWQNSKIDGVIERYEVTERTARRWLKRAKDEGIR